MKQSLISVIMPCFNAEPFVEQAIESVFGQSHPSVELIVIDDGSTDASFQKLEEACKRFPGLKVIRQNNQGPYPARNLGIASAQGDFVAFLDADDYWSPDCLEKLYNAMTSSDADISYCGWQNISEVDQNGPPYIPPAYEDEDIILSLLTNGPWPIHAALVRRPLIDRVNGFSTRYFSSMDYDFWLRLSAVSKKIIRVPEVLAFYRWHQYGQISSIKWKQVIDAWKVKKDFCKNHPDSIAHIPYEVRREVIDNFLITHAYTAFWKRDLVSAQQLFRVMFTSNTWRMKDLPYIATSFLTYRLFSSLVDYISNDTKK